ncbi:tetratricopeptide (TPR) repeat protein [Thermocatellispora tengchongensis]|uniref:Tetratricopeptide (TPR) repeat protein n=1 Tax=Thermocatellispora tengchongensis TaxID=1073253 RepID=A0A840P683_9ACTN|nr:tetratricopeptide repeat protein [Thermocatellispora tengchongensis]MBB5133413.1 tetratricopeptide (TPR) repeat protein [Thermocatellispora tengchongensis]
MDPAQVVTAAESIERARTLLGLRRPAEAERELRGVLARDPQHAAAHALLALALSGRGATAEAVREAREAVRLAPENWLPHYVAGQVHYRARHAAEALAAAEAALSLAPEHVPVWELLARVHVLRGRWPQVAEAARHGLAIDPQHAGLVSLLALALTMLGDAEGARAAAAQALRIDPESPTAHLVSGRAELAFGDPRRAAEAFREVLRLDPGFHQARDLLVTALKRRNPLYRPLTRLRRRFRGRWWMVFLLPALPPVILVFVLIALLHWAAWVAEAWTTLRLARAKATRLLFEGAEARVALACCCLLAAGAALLALGIALGADAAGIAGVAVMALVTPVEEAAHTGSLRARAVLYAWTALLALAVAASLILSQEAIALLVAYAALATIWVASGVRAAPRAIRKIGRRRAPR